MLSRVSYDNVSLSLSLSLSLLCARDYFIVLIKLFLKKMFILGQAQ